MNRIPKTNILRLWALFALLAVALAGCQAARGVVQEARATRVSDRATRVAQATDEPVEPAASDPTAEPTEAVEVESTAEPTVEPTADPTAPPATATAATVQPAGTPIQAGEETALTEIEVGRGIFGVQVAPQVAQLACEPLRQTGARSTPLWVRRGEVDLGGGQYDWTIVDQKIDALSACGLDVALHVQAGSAEERSGMPDDLNAYAAFLTALVTHLDGRVTRYSIENEAVSPSVWPDSPEAYFELLDVAYRTIKAANPDAIVLNSGISSASLGIMLVNDLVQRGDGESALEVARAFARYSPGGPDAVALNSETDLQPILSNELAQRAIRWMQLEIENQDSYDAFQFHYYGTWEQLPRAMRWIRAMGIRKPIEIWELNRRYHDQSAFDDFEHADETARSLVTAAGEGSQYTIFLRYNDWTEKGLPGLVTRQGARPAEAAYRVVAEKLNDFQRAAQIDLGPNIWAYRFTGPERDVLVVWTTDGSETTLSLPIQGQVQVTDVTGNAMAADPAQITVTGSPLFID